MHALPTFATTVVGSFPQTDASPLSEHLVKTLDIPAWPQLPRRDFRESMYAQYSRTLPAARLYPEAEKVSFMIDDDLATQVLPFYEALLEENLGFFALTPEYAAGFFAMLDALAATHGEWAKGQVTGPISLGLTVTDQNLRSGLYNEQLADVIVKNAAMNARWQIRRLQEVRPNVIIFVDEPYMASFGSAFISLNREDVVRMLDEVFEVIHAEGALAGVHCCANTDWSVLLSTTVDILNLDSYGYLENLALYPAELSAFLERGGRVAWGSIPNDSSALSTDAETLAGRLMQGLEHVAARGAEHGMTVERLVEGALLTPSCGLGSANEAIADAALRLLAQTAERLRQGCRKPAAQRRI